MRILLATDGSEHSRMAARAIVALKPSHGTEIALLTVVPEHVFLGGLRLQMPGGRDQAHRAEEEKAAVLLREAAALLPKDGVETRDHISRGKVAEQIIVFAREWGAGLVVIGAKGTTESDRFRLGAVAQKVMKYAACSVLLVREDIARLTRVLLPTDGSRYSLEAERLLVELPLPHSAHVFLMTALHSHAPALLKMPTLDMETYRQIVAELQTEEEKQARIILDRSSREFRHKGYETTSLVRRGDPASEILSTSEVVNPDLIVMGSKGLTGIESFLMGSVAQRVARSAAHSVMIVRHRA